MITVRFTTYKTERKRANMKIKQKSHPEWQESTKFRQYDFIYVNFFA